MTTYRPRSAVRALTPRRGVILLVVLLLLTLLALLGLTFVLCYRTAPLASVVRHG